MADESGKLKFWRAADGSGTLRFGDWGQPKPQLQNGLLFRRPADGSGKLVFGYTVNPGTASTPDADIALDAGFAGDMPAHIGITVPIGLGIDAGFADDMAADVGLAWDSNASRPLLARANPAFQQAQPRASLARAHWQRSQPLSVAQRAHWQVARLLAGLVRPHWQASLPLRNTARVAFEQGRLVHDLVRGGFQQSIALRAGARSAFEQGAPLLAGTRLGFQQTISLRAGARSRMQQALAVLGDGVRSPLRAGLPVWVDTRIGFQQARYPLPGITHIVVDPGPGPELCYDPARLGTLVFERPFVANGKLLFICRRAGEPEEPGQPPGQVIVPVRRAYIVINDIELIRIDGAIALPAYAFALRLDADSWTWQWSATLHHATLAALAPAQGGAPVAIQATINGVVYKLLAEQVRRERRFAQDRVVVSGRGLAAILDAPYAPAQTFDNTAGARSAQQLMGDVLTVNGVDIGWSVDFGLADWQVPAGAWAHQGSYVSAINAIAGAAGGYVQPHPTAQTLRILHRYPLAPWDWAGVTPDYELPLAATSVEALQWRKRPDYDRVFVAGQDGAGIVGQVTRTGKPGDQVAPMVVDPLITDVPAARQRGRAILGDTGAQAIVTLTLPVLPETGLILPGKFVRRTDGAQSVQGYVRGLSVNWSRPRMRQTIEVETHGQ